MEISQVQLRNFGPFKRATFDVDGQGLVLVEGENLDEGGSNGAGKSHLADAISWCLFGKTLRDSAYDSVIRAGSTKGTWARVSLVSFGRSFTVTRYRKHPEHKNAVQIFEGEKDITPSVNVEVLLRSLLRISSDVWQYAISLGQGLAYRFSRLPDAQRVNLLEQVLGTDVYEPARVYARAKLKAIRSRLDGLERERTLLDEQARSQGQQVRAAQDVVTALMSQPIVSGGAELIPQLKLDVAHLEKQVQEAEMLRKAHSDEARQQEALQRAAASEEAKYRAEVQRLSKAAQAAQDTARVIAAGTCDRCGQPVAGQRQERIEATLTKSSEIDLQKGDMAAAQVARAEQAKEAARARVEAARTGMEAMEAQLSSLRQTFQNANTELAKLQAAIPARGARSLAQSALDAAKQRLETVQAKVRICATSHAEQQRQLRLWDFWADGFSRLRQVALTKGVEFLSKAFSVYVEKLFGKALGAEVQLIEKQTSSGTGTRVIVNVATPGGDYQTASGGERDRIDLALAFALHDLVTQASGFHCNLLLADELGGHVDPEGIARIIAVLREKADQVGTVFCMTQSPVWKDWITDTWLVRKQDGIAELLRLKN